MKPVDVKSDFYTEYNDDSIEKDPKFHLDGREKISKYKNILLKEMLLIGQKKFLLLAKLKMLYHELMLLVI